MVVVRGRDSHGEEETEGVADRARPTVLLRARVLGAARRTPLMERPGERLLFGGPWGRGGGDIAHPLCERAPWRTAARGRHRRSLAEWGACDEADRRSTRHWPPRGGQTERVHQGLACSAQAVYGADDRALGRRNWTPPASNQRPSHWPKRLSRGPNLGYAKTL